MSEKSLLQARTNYQICARDSNADITAQDRDDHHKSVGTGMDQTPSSYSYPSTKIIIWLFISLELFHLNFTFTSISRLTGTTAKAISSADVKY